MERKTRWDGIVDVSRSLPSYRNSCLRLILWQPGARVIIEKFMGENPELLTCWPVLCLAKWPRVHPHLHLKNCWANSPE
jgi:hypothetical protein